MHYLNKLYAPAAYAHTHTRPFLFVTKMLYVWLPFINNLMFMQFYCQSSTFLKVKIAHYTVHCPQLRQKNNNIK